MKIRLLFIVPFCALVGYVLLARPAQLSVGRGMYY